MIGFIKKIFPNVIAQCVEHLFTRLLLAIQNAILGLVAWTPYSGKESAGKPRCILMLRTAALGDFIFSIPAMAELRNRFPGARIILLTATTTSQQQQSAVHKYTGTKTLPWLEFVVPTVVNEAIYIRSFSFGTLLNEIRNQVRNANPDVTVILAHPGEPGFSLLKKLLFLRMVGVHSNIYGWRARSSITWFRKYQYSAGLLEHHVVGPLRSVADMPGMPSVEKMQIIFPLNIDLSAEMWVEKFLNETGFSGKPIVAVAPGSIQPHKRWPIENYMTLFQKLSRKHDINTVVIGTSLDKSLGDGIVKAMGKKFVNLAGVTTLAETAALLQRCKLLVGNDGGAMHLGSAVGCPVVSIVPGIEYPDSIEPWFSRDLAVRHPVSCAPCYSFTHCPMKHNKCMVELPVTDVYERCTRVLGREYSSEVMS